LMGVSGGAINPMTAGLITGGLSYAMTGSLQKGLMAGLGAYGGANLGSGLMENAVTMDPAVIDAQKAVVNNAIDTQFNPLKTNLTAEQFASSLPANQLEINKTLADKLVAERATAAGPGDFMGNIKNMFKGAGTLGEKGGLDSLYQNLGGSPMSLLKSVGSAAAPAIGEAMTPKKQEEEKADADMGQRYGFSMNPTGGQRQVQPGQDPLANTQSPTTTPFPTPDIYGREQRYFAPSYTKLTPEQAKELYGYAEGGTAQANPQPATETETPAMRMFKQMQAQRAAQPPTPQIDANAEFAKYAQQTLGAPNQLKAPTNFDNSEGGAGLGGSIARALAKQDSSSELIYDPVKQTYNKNPNFVDAAAVAASDDPLSPENLAGNFAANHPGVPYSQVDPKTGIWTKYDRYGNKMNADGGLMAAYAGGGMSNLGDYSDGGRLLRGPGDGVSDSIPAMIGKKQPARLADGEFVVPARIVSELGNGSTEAGARKLYAMMDRIQSARGKTVGKGKVAKNSRADRLLPA